VQALRLGLLDRTGEHLRWTAEASSQGLPVKRFDVACRTCGRQWSHLFGDGNEDTIRCPCGALVTVDLGSSTNHSDLDCSTPEGRRLRAATLDLDTSAAELHVLCQTTWDMLRPHQRRRLLKEPCVPDNVIGSWRRPTPRSVLDLYDLGLIDHDGWTPLGKAVAAHGKRVGEIETRFPILRVSS
jgi:hypothetical protein